MNTPWRGLIKGFLLGMFVMFNYAQAEPFSALNNLTISGCQDYPYHLQTIEHQVPGIIKLKKDLSEGLQQGLSCLAGTNPRVGQLHRFHQRQGEKLQALLTNEQPKSIQCVKDELFAYAMASSPRQQLASPVLKKRLDNSVDLTILLDTYRIGGLLSTKFKPATYKNFFKMNQQQIDEHLTGKPLRMKGLHRYKNLPALLFHETVHWLGHEHSNITPDVTFLYETCCFGGSEYIEDEKLNSKFQTRACNILRDDELWSSADKLKTKLWKKKGYRKLKTEMRKFY